MSGHRERSFRRACLGACAWIFGIAAAVGLLESRGWLNGLQTAGLDLMVRNQQAETSEEIFVVEITDEDYDGPYFHSTSHDPGGPRLASNAAGSTSTACARKNG